MLQGVFSRVIQNILEERTGIKTIDFKFSRKRNLVWFKMYVKGELVYEAKINAPYPFDFFDDIVVPMEKAVTSLQIQKQDWAKLHLIYLRREDGSRSNDIVGVSLKDYKREKLPPTQMSYIVDEYEKCDKDIVLPIVKVYPKYEIQLISGFQWKGAKVRRNQTKAELIRLLNWACAIDLLVNHSDRFIQVNGFSANDMW